MSTLSRDTAIAASATAVTVGVLVVLERRRRRRELSVAKPSAAAISTPCSLHAPATATALNPCAVAFEPASSTSKPESAAAAALELIPPREEELTSPPPATVEPKELDKILRELNNGNRTAVKNWEKREWDKAKARLDVVEARAAAEAAAGVESLAQKSARILAEARAAREASAGENSSANANAAFASALASDEAAEAKAKAASVAAIRALPGATEASIAAELRRWPKPPPGSDPSFFELGAHQWPLYLDHYDWLDEVAVKYCFNDAGEVLRHLIFAANGESPKVKKLIFTVIRCLHCHSGARAGHIPKRDKSLAVFGFQRQWLEAVQVRSSHPTVEKTVRVTCDYYRKITSDMPGMEAELFWRNRTDVKRA